MKDLLEKQDLLYFSRKFLDFAPFKTFQDISRLIQFDLVWIFSNFPRRSHLGLQKTGSPVPSRLKSWEVKKASTADPYTPAAKLSFVEKFLKSF